MQQNTLPLALILAGGIIIDTGFLYLSAAKAISITAIILGAILFWQGFRRLT